MKWKIQLDRSLADGVRLTGVEGNPVIQPGGKGGIYEYLICLIFLQKCIIFLKNVCFSFFTPSPVAFSQAHRKSNPSNTEPKMARNLSCPGNLKALTPLKG